MTREEALEILDWIPTIGEQVDALEMAIKALEQEPRWIPVSERLPEEEGTYLLWGKLTDYEDYYCFIGDYDEGCEQFGYWEQQFDSNTLGCLGEEFFEYECVIAWMPLPQPYKAESEEENDNNK